MSSFQICTAFRSISFPIMHPLSNTISPLLSNLLSIPATFPYILCPNVSWTATVIHINPLLHPFYSPQTINTQPHHTVLIVPVTQGCRKSMCTFWLLSCHDQNVQCLMLKVLVHQNLLQFITEDLCLSFSITLLLFLYLPYVVIGGLCSLNKISPYFIIIEEKTQLNIIAFVSSTSVWETADSLKRFARFLWTVAIVTLTWAQD